MHDNVLVLGDGSRNFMRSVRLAALYSEKVHVWTPTSDTTISFMEFGVGLASPDPGSVEDWLDDALTDEDRDLLSTQPAARSLLVEKYRREYCDHPAKRFLSQCVAEKAELETFRREGALLSALELFAANIPNLQTEGTAFLKGMSSAIGGIKKQILQPDEMPPELTQMDAPGYSHIAALFSGLLEGVLSFGVINGVPEIEQLEQLFDQHGSEAIGVGLYFWLASYYACLSGCAGVSADLTNQELFDSTVSAVSDSLGSNPLAVKRNRIRAKLGEEVLRAEVPDLSNLRADEILSLREQRNAELQAFRTSLSSLATNIDLGLDENDLNLAVQDEINRQVRPKIMDLRAALNSASRRAAMDALKGANTAGLVTFALSAATQLPIETNAQLTAGAIALEKMINWVVANRVARKDALKSSPWSILLHLKNEA